jgi:FMN-dependent oxidoreductase (nitrilotriacetate monooxygenase family)
MTPYLTLSVIPVGVSGGDTSPPEVVRARGYEFAPRVKLAEVARDGGFDALWLPDLPHHFRLGNGAVMHPYEPNALLTAIAALVPEIGVVTTVSTTYTEPYNIARAVLSMDWISGGRAGVNLVASWAPTVAANFGMERVPDYDERYGRADEYLEILKGLFDGFTLPDGAPDTVAPLDFIGKYLKVSGPGTAPRYGAHRPLVSTAGGSEHAIELAVKHADVLYVAALSPAASARFNAEARSKARAVGRRDEELLFVPGVQIILGATDEEAELRLDALIAGSGDKRSPLEWVAQLLAIPAAELHPDRPLTEEQLTTPSPGFARPYGFFRALTDLAREEALTVGQLGQRLRAGIGHRVLVGSPEKIADDLAHWRDTDAADGFVLHPHAGGDDLPLLSEHLMPLLRRRGIVRPGYEKQSLRQRFGLH